MLAHKSYTILSQIKWCKVYSFIDWRITKKITFLLTWVTMVIETSNRKEVTATQLITSKVVLLSDLLITGSQIFLNCCSKWRLQTLLESWKRFKDNSLKCKSFCNKLIIVCADDKTLRAEGDYIELRAKGGIIQVYLVGCWSLIC